MKRILKEPVLDVYCTKIIPALLLIVEYHAKTTAKHHAKR